MKIIACSTFAGSPETDEPRFTRIYLDETILGTPFDKMPPYMAGYDEEHIMDKSSEIHLMKEAAINHVHNAIYDFPNTIDTRFAFAFIYNNNAVPLVDIYGFVKPVPFHDRSIKKWRFVGGDLPKKKLEEITHNRFDYEWQTPSKMWRLLNIKQEEHPTEISQNVSQILELERQNILCGDFEKYRAKTIKGRMVEAFLKYHPLGLYPIYCPTLDHIMEKPYLMDKF